MRLLSLCLAGISASVGLVVASLGSGGVAFASFHCVRIHAVMAGFAGNNNIQYVELRMDGGAQNLVNAHTLKFFDTSGVLKATFTFPANVTNGATGDSILVATQEFNAAALGGPADFVFTNANTAGTGDPLHPIQGANGKVEWAADASSFACPPAILPPDSVAYGTAPADPGFGAAAVALPSPGDNRALRLSDLNVSQGNNNTEYSLKAVSTSTFTVAPGSLAGDFTTPRNNARTVLQLTTPLSVGGVAEEPDVSRLGASIASDHSGGTGYRFYGGVAAMVVLASAALAACYVHRRRVAAQ